MKPISSDIAFLLEQGGAGVRGGQNDWGIYVGTEPDKPDRVITIYDTGGDRPPNPRYLLNYPSFQIRVRGRKHDYEAAYAKQLEIRGLLLGFPSGVVDHNDATTPTWYVGIWQNSDIGYIGELQARPLLTSNWRAIIEPPDDGGHRVPL